MKQKTILGLWFTLLVVSALACQTLSGIGGQIQQARESVEQVRTEVGSIATQSDALLATARAVATEHPDALATGQALATRAPEVLATGQALVTEQGLLSTVEAFITEKPDILQTAQAVATKGLPFGEAPSDIPSIPNEETNQYFSTKDFVTYATSRQYDDVLSFYKQEMQAWGWEAEPNDSFEFQNNAMLVFKKPDRIATVMLSTNPINDQTIVAITISSR